MTHFMRYRMVQIVILLCLVAVLLPAKVCTRMVIIAKTPIVFPTKGRVVYSNEYYRKYEKLISQAAEEYNVPALLIAAVIKAESDFDSYAVSKAGAMGLMQLMPETWAELGGVGSPFNPGNNIRLGTKYLRELMDQFRGNLSLTIAAYNAGPGAVMKFRSIPPYRETRRYVPRVLKIFRNYRKTIG